MEIAKNIAAEIANELSETIGQNINMMNTQGVIIASSDPTRIGELHEGAKKLIDEGLEYLIVRDDTQFKGSRSGVNLPIFLENELVGTIGITGPVDQVLQYGKIIKRMTEILLLENKAREQKVIEQKAKDRFYDEWILGSLEEKNEIEFKRMAESLSVNYDTPVRIAVLSFSSNKPLSDNTLTEISRMIRHAMANKLEGNCFRTATQMVCIIEKCKETELENALIEIFTKIENSYNCKCFAGIDSEGSIFHLNSSYKEAAKALEIAEKREVAIVYYDSFELDFIFENISKETKDRFMNKLFKKCSSDEARDMLSFAKNYLECNGSLIDLSERLFIHKNTVKYKINKMTDATGVDIRTCHGAYVFSLALNLFGEDTQTI